MEKNIGTGRKIGRKIVVMLVAFTMLFSVAMFVGCTNDNSELLNELAQLRELIEEKSGLSQQVQDLTDLVNGMKEDNAGLAEKIEALQGGIDGLAKRLGGLEASNGYLLGMIGGLQEQLEELREKLRKITGGDPATCGSFYSLTASYENEWLTQANLKNISYHFHGSVFFNGEFIDFNGSPLGLLCEKVKNHIILDYKRIFPNAVGINTLRVTYLGTFNDTIVVEMRLSIMHSPVPFIETVGGVIFRHLPSSYIRVWSTS